MNDYGKNTEEEIKQLLALKESGELEGAELEAVDAILEQAYKHIQQWQKFTARYHVNALDISLKNIDFRREDVLQAIDYASVFFGFLSPRVRENAEAVAMIVLKDKQEECELSYNLHAFKDVGLLTKDALQQCMVHEVAHEYLQGKPFRLFRNEMWTQELAADYISGAYSWKHNLTIGHYKYAIGGLCATLSHPDGEMRSEAFLCGYLTSRDLWFSQIEFSIPQLLKYFPDFIFKHFRRLSDDWMKIKSQDFDNIITLLPVRKRGTDITYMKTMEVITTEPKKIVKR